MAGSIKFKISVDGTVSLEVDGVTGQRCSDLTRSFEEALGVKVDDQLKPEYFVELDGINQHAEIHETE